MHQNTPAVESDCQYVAIIPGTSSHFRLWQHITLQSHSCSLIADLISDSPTTTLIFRSSWSPSGSTWPSLGTRTYQCQPQRGISEKIPLKISHSAFCLAPMFDKLLTTLTWWLHWPVTTSPTRSALFPNVRCFLEEKKKKSKFLWFLKKKYCFLSPVFPQVCAWGFVWHGVDLHAQQARHAANRTHRESAIKTTPCQSDPAVKNRGRKVKEEPRVHKDWQFFKCQHLLEPELECKCLCASAHAHTHAHTPDRTLCNIDESVSALGDGVVFSCELLEYLFFHFHF